MTVSSVIEKEESSATESTSGSVKVNDDESLPDEGAGLRLVGNIVSVGLERLNLSIRYVTGHGSEGRDRDNRGDDGLTEANVDAETISSPSGSHELSELDKKWLRNLTLGQPDLLDALCQNIARQQHGGPNFQMDARREPDAGEETPEFRVEEVLHEDSARSEQAIFGTLEQFEVKILVLNSVLAFFSFPSITCFGRELRSKFQVSL